MISVLLMASGAAWETDAFGRLNRESGMVVLKRCVDVDDLLATASRGQADVAVVGLDAPGLDPAAVNHLHRHGLRLVAVVADSVDDVDDVALASRLGITSLVSVGDLADLAQAVTTAEQSADTAVRDVTPVPGTDPAAHRVVTVWGPTGAPGRTTVAVALAVDSARRGQATVLLDADPYGGSVAQHLGVLDEVSGLLSATRLAGAGQLADRFMSTARTVNDRLSVVTGLPRADRWIEVGRDDFASVVEHAQSVGDVVLDTGFGLEEEAVDDFGRRPSRNTMTLTALELADEVVVVGSADPPGLTRLARGLVDLRDVMGAVPVRVVINRMRPSLGWSEREIAGMVEGFARISGLHFLPLEQATIDRALVAGRSVVEGGEGPLARGLAGLTDAVFPATIARESGRRRGVRRRR